MLTEGWVDYLTGPWGIGFALVAGVISFLSPCVLPLVPVYIAHLTGVGAASEGSGNRRETMSHALAFVLGFGLVFTVIGASVGLVGSLIRDELPTLEKVAGVFLVIMGLNLMGIIKIPFLYRTYQFGAVSPQPALAVAGAGGQGGVATATAVQETSLSYARSLGMGSAFAVAWTPCIGPVLGAILTLAAASTTVMQGAYLLLAYSAGLALPFLAAGFAIGAMNAVLRRFRRFMPAVELAAGVVVIAVGVLIFTNEFASLNRYFQFITALNAV